MHSNRGNRAVGIAKRIHWQSFFVFEPSGKSIRPELASFTLVNLISLAQTWVVAVGLVRFVWPTFNMMFHPERLGQSPGIDLLRAIRRRAIKLPVVFLTECKRAAKAVVGGRRPRSEDDSPALRFKGVPQHALLAHRPCGRAPKLFTPSLSFRIRKRIFLRFDSELWLSCPHKHSVITRSSCSYSQNGDFRLFISYYVSFKK